ncbi:MAG: hypothetical protein ACRESF_01920 [Pseudomonas sp.]
MSGEYRLLEFVQSSGDKLPIDRAKGIIRGVKLLGEESANPPPNNNFYPRQTRERAILLFEGRRVCINHPDDYNRTRPYQDGMGKMVGVREGGDGLYGDWHFPPGHPLAESVFWDAENNPGGLGFSINGQAGNKRQEGSRVVVEEIASVESIDLVSRPATTKGLYESQRRKDKPMKKKLRVLIEELKARRPGYARGLLEAAEAGIMSPESEYEEPKAEEAESPGGEGMDHAQAILDAAIACIRDPNLDTAGKITKIRKLLGMSDTQEAEGDEEGPEEKEDLEESGSDELRGKNKKGQIRAIWAKDPHGDYHPSNESRRPKRHKGNAVIESLRMQLKVSDLCADAGVQPNKVLRKALSACKNEAEAKELIEEARKQTTTTASPFLQRGAKSAAVSHETLGIQEARQPAGNGTATNLQFKTAQERNDFLRRR